MRALVLTEWSKLVVADRDDPVLGVDEVLLEVVATGICGSDIHGFTGENGRRHAGQVMGHETVGRIAALGSGVRSDDGIAVGELATINPVVGCTRCARCRSGLAQACPDKTVIGVTPSTVGAFAQLIAVPASNVVPLPQAMPVEYGALVEPLAVGYHAARRGNVAAGARVLVLGGGPVGQACVLGAQRLGAHAVAVSEPSPLRRAINSSLGAASIDPYEVRDLAAAVTAEIGGAPDVVIDAVGTSRSLSSALSCAPPMSTVVLVGMGQSQIDLSAFEISIMERTLVGSFCYSPAEFIETAAWTGGAPAILANMIGDTVGMQEAPEAFTKLATNDALGGKVLVLPQQPSGLSGH
jgi:threonine dehydrogenase-like Zn-dependent dehydrogenase